MVANETAALLLSESTLNSISPFLGRLSVLVGGIFGISLIVVLSRIYFDHQRLKVMRDIRYNLEQLNSHFGVSSSQHRLGFIRRTWQRLKTWYYNHKFNQSNQKLQDLRSRRK